MFFVRSATPGDLAEVSALLRRTWHATHDAIHGAERVAAITAQWHSPAALERNLTKPASEFVVADDGERIGGVAYAAMTDKDVASLLQLYVLPEYQRQGIGRDLFAEIETCFDDAKWLRTEVDAANTGAIAFYERHGMTPARKTLAASPSKGDVVVMEKPIP